MEPRDIWHLDLMHLIPDFTVADMARAGGWDTILRLLTDHYGEI